MFYSLNVLIFLCSYKKLITIFGWIYLLIYFYFNIFESLYLKNYVYLLNNWVLLFILPYLNIIYLWFLILIKDILFFSNLLGIYICYYHISLIILFRCIVKIILIYISNIIRYNIIKCIIHFHKFIFYIFLKVICSIYFYLIKI